MTEDNNDSFESKIHTSCGRLLISIIIAVVSVSPSSFLTVLVTKLILAKLNQKVQFSGAPN